MTQNFEIMKYMHLFFIFWAIFVPIVSSFNIQNNAPNILQPEEKANIKSSSFFGYNIQYGFGSDDALKFVFYIFCKNRYLLKRDTF